MSYMPGQGLKKPLEEQCWDMRNRLHDLIETLALRPPEELGMHMSHAGLLMAEAGLLILSQRNELVRLNKLIAESCANGVALAEDRDCG